MTIKELSQLHWLSREIERDQHRLEELESTAVVPSTAGMDGMPHGHGLPSSKTEQAAMEITDLKAIIAAKQIQCIHERQRLERYIASVPDGLTRLIMELRFVDGLNWTQAAVQIGGGNTVGAIKKRVYRYLDSTEEKNGEDSESCPQMSREYVV